MSMTDLHQKLFADLVSRAEFADAIGKSERTVVRMNLPTKYIGRDPYIVVSKAMAKLLGVEKPTRGRPRAVKFGEAA
jgi:hypothetical protein